MAEDRVSPPARGPEEPGGPGVGGDPRGRLKVFLGMAPGVGKTFAMLASAHRMAAQGVDVAVGVVETHGRPETEQLLLGMDIIPRREVRVSAAGGAGVVTREFDVEAAIARRPDVLLVDELAHSNAPGSAREKRWQDVAECLRAGVDVHTTLNVQHLESLVDVVAQITGVSVRETVPDDVFDGADEVELVDLPVEGLLDRLRAGKVYSAENASRAVDPSDGFFRRGNLTALRELALRRTAAWVDSDLRRYRRDRGIRAVWPAGERVVVAVSPSPMSPRLVRAAKRIAAGLHADLVAVYVDRPGRPPPSPEDRGRLAATMRLAESLGATTAVLTADHPARELAAYARSRNATRIVVGKTARPRWREALLGSFTDELIRESGDIEIAVVRGDDTPEPSAARRGVPGGPGVVGWGVVGRSAAALGLVAGVTALGWVAFAGLELANVAMVYLAAVVVAALWLGRGPAMLAAAAGVAAFDFCFVPPRLTLAVTDAQYLVTFAVMLGVGVVVATLASRSREHAAASAGRERRTAALYAVARELSAARDVAAVAAVGARHAHDAAGGDALVAEPAGAGLRVLACSGAPDWFDEREMAVARWSFDHGAAAGRGTASLPAASGWYCPLAAAGGRVGVLGVRAAGVGWGGWGGDGEAVATLESIAGQVASALERVTLAESREAARVEAERERLRAALLSSVSHDLRTPLAGITGAASTLEQPGLDEATRRGLLASIVAESGRLSDLIANLVFATRLESGAVDPRREWTTVEEIVGVGLRPLRDRLSQRPFRVVLPPGLPMVRVDGAMLPQVVKNLVENALRYTPAGTPITVSASARDGGVFLRVADEGPGLAEGESGRVFQRFYRGRTARGVGDGAGMGLGLTICEGIVRAHGGRVWAEANVPRGVVFVVRLPVERQPALPAELAVGEEADR